MSKIIITIVGQDRVGIVAKTCNYLADHNMNILDITPVSYTHLRRSCRNISI